MKKGVTLIALLLTVLCASAQKPTKLFNGKSLDGWSKFTKNISDIESEVYSVKDRTINITGEFGYLYTNKEYSDYKLTLQWRWVDEGTNSGVFLNMQGENKAWPNCYEVQLANGMAGDIIHAGDVSSDEYAASGNKKSLGAERNIEKEIGEWNDMEVICSKESIVVYINGVKQNEIHNITQPSGHIGLQSEGKGIQFRNIELTPILL